MLSGALRSFSGALCFVSGFWVFENKICQTAGDEIFSPPHIILGVGKQQELENKFCQIIGDALKLCRVEILNTKV
jgi:hypothetical protein